FATPERRVVFDINDFDETLPAPWEWDMKRLAASFVIAGRNNKFSEKDAKNAALQCVTAYRQHINEFSQILPLNRWYASIDIQDLVDLIHNRVDKKRIQRRLAKETARNAVEHDFPKLATVKAGKARITDNPPLIFHPKRYEQADFQKLISRGFSLYLQTLPDDRRALLNQFEVHDYAMKVVGVGSVGTRCAILLLVAGNDDPLFLQVKEARASVLEPFAGKSKYQNHGQ